MQAGKPASHCDVRDVKEIRAKWKVQALATQHGTERFVAGSYLLVNGAGTAMPQCRSATDFNVALLVNRQHYRRVNPVTGVVFAPSDQNFCAIAPIDAAPINGSTTHTWGWFAASDDSTLAAPTFVARVRNRGVAPLSGWTALQDYDYTSPTPPPVTSNELAASSKSKECAMNIALGLGPCTHLEIAKQRSANEAGGRGSFADSELQLSAAIAAAPVPVVLRTMGGDALQLDWSGPWRVSATTPFAIDVRALAAEQYPGELGHHPEEFDLVPIRDEQDGGDGGGGAHNEFGVATAGGGAAAGAAASPTAAPSPAPSPSEAADDDVSPAGNASGSGDVIYAADVGLLRSTTAPSGNSFTTIDLDAAEKILRMAAGKELGYLVLMRHQVSVKISVRKQANDAAQAPVKAGASTTAGAMKAGDVFPTVNLVANHTEATVGYVRRKLVAHLQLDAASFTVRIQRQATEEGLWDDAAEMTYSKEEPRQLIVTQVLLSDSSVPSHWRKKKSPKTEKGCTIA